MTPQPMNFARCISVLSPVILRLLRVILFSTVAWPALVSAALTGQGSPAAGEESGLIPPAGSPKTPSEIAILRTLGTSGDAIAQNNLGYAYTFGRGVIQDYREAAKWYSLAASSGLSSAQCNLG